MIIPAIFQWVPQGGPSEDPSGPPPTPEIIIPTPQLVPTAAMEPNYTRVAWPVILNNYPDFNWQNPGQFEDNALDSTAYNNPMAAGYDASISPPSTGAEAYPTIFTALEGLNESNIRVLYLDADYNWIQAPFQIDQRGWVNSWQMADLNRWAALDMSSGTMRGQGGTAHMAGDGQPGLGWVAGDPAHSWGGMCYPWGTYPNTPSWGSAPAEATAPNDLKMDWYRIPQWNYVSKYQPDGSYTDENVHIDPEYRDDLVWTFMRDSRMPHRWFMEGDYNSGEGTYGDAPFNGRNPWNMNPGASQGSTRENQGARYHRASVEGRLPAWLRTTDGNDPTSGELSNVVFMGDTWFTTPCNDPALQPDANVRGNFSYEQIAGALDKDDELVFYAQNGRKAPVYLWWNYEEFPKRIEFEIDDPVDDGKAWMYIYYNDDDNYNPIKNASAVNLGLPEFTDYISWDPGLMTVSSDYYQLSVDPLNPSLLDSARMLGITDGKELLTDFNRMYAFAHVTEHLVDLLHVYIPIAREGNWYNYPAGSANYYSDLVANMDNPTVLYPGISDDTSVMHNYDQNSSEQTADRSAAVSPYYGTDSYPWTTNPPGNGYYGPMGSRADPNNQPQMVPAAGLGPSYQDWEIFGDKRAIIDGPCRVIMYLQQWLVGGLHIDLEASQIQVFQDDIEIMFPMLDGAQIYYRRHQISPETTVELPGIPSIEFQVYYVYLLTGAFPTAHSGDFTLTSVREWNGVNDGNDNGKPRFGFEEGLGWTKIGTGGTSPLYTDTGYTVLGTSVPDGNSGSGDYYAHGGDPLLDTAPCTSGDPYPPPNGQNPDSVPPEGGNNLNLPDWLMISSETHGGLWMQVPRREIYEMRDNSGLNASLQHIDFKLYFRDDARREFGICADGDATPYVIGGCSTSPYRLMMVYGDFKTSDADLMDKGHKLYHQYYFDLGGSESEFTPQSKPENIFLFETAQPDKLIYGSGDDIVLEVDGNYDGSQGATVFINTKDINSGDANATMTPLDDGNGRFTYTYTISSIDPPTTNYDRLISFSGHLLGTSDASLYDLLYVTIDTVIPDQAPVLVLSASAGSSYAYLDWTADAGYDIGSASMANPRGIVEYDIERRFDPAGGTSYGSWSTLATIPYDETNATYIYSDSFLDDGYRYEWRVRAHDAAGNSRVSNAENALIDLAYTPAQPDSLPPTINPSGGITIDWTDNPGLGTTISGYRVYRGDSPDPGDASWADVSGLLGSTTYSWPEPGAFLSSAVEAQTYYWRVLTDSSTAPDLYSGLVSSKIDRVEPAPGELATPLPDYLAEKNEIIVSWALETLPQYETGGFPGQDLNGIDHYIVERQEGAGPMLEVANVPWGPATEDQRYLDTDVTNNTQYTYRLTTYDAAGNFATCLVDKTTTLRVIGPGVAEPRTVTAGPGTVMQGESNYAVSVTVKNVGCDSVTVDQVELILKEDGIYDVTSEYTGTVLTPSETLTSGQEKEYVFYVGVSASATLGIIEIDAKTTYTRNSVQHTLEGATLATDSWQVLPDADLIINKVNSTKAVVYPGDDNIPVYVMITNPGNTQIDIESVALTFSRDDSLFVDTIVTSLPVSLTSDSTLIQFDVSVAGSITAGPVTVDAIASGTVMDQPISDTDGAGTPLSWAVATTADPVIMSVTADDLSYWHSDVVTLTVTCQWAQTAYDPVRADFTALGGSWVSGTTTDNTVYTITNTLPSSGLTAGIYTIPIEATNGTGTTDESIDLTIGIAPTISAPIQNPTDGNVEPDVTVDIDVDISGGSTTTAKLEYRVDGGSWILRPMTYAGSDHWDVTIPGQTAGAYVEYKITATSPEDLSSERNEHYTVTPPPPEPTLQEGSQSAYNPSNGNPYNETDGPALDSLVEYGVTIETDFLDAPGVFTVLVSLHDPDRNNWLYINDSVPLSPASPPVQVVLNLVFQTGEITSGTIVRGSIFILTDLPSNNGETLAWLPIVHTID